VGKPNVGSGQYSIPKGSFVTNDPTGTLVFTGACSFGAGVDCHIVNEGLLQVNAGSSTIDFATPFPLDIFRDTPGTSNTGTIEVVSGVLKFPITSFSANAGTIDTGTHSTPAQTPAATPPSPCTAMWPHPID
jgi:hypothetical protein